MTEQRKHPAEQDVHEVGFFRGAGRGEVLDAVLSDSGAFQIEAPAGAGKTRLAREAVTMWRARGLVVDCFNPALETVEQNALMLSVRHADVVVVDDVDRLPLSMFTILADAPSRTRLLLLADGMVEPAFKGVRVFSLAALEPADLARLLARSPSTRAPRWDGDDLTEIIQRTGGSFGAVLRVLASGVAARPVPRMPWRHFAAAVGMAFATVGFAWIGGAPAPPPTEIELSPEFDSPAALRRFEEAEVDGGAVDTLVPDAPAIFGEEEGEPLPPALRETEVSEPMIDDISAPVDVADVRRVVESAAEAALTATVQARAPLEARGPNVPRGAAWLLRRAPDHFTIQLFATSSQGNIEAFLEAQQDRSSFAVFDQVQGGIRIHVIAYGAYPSKAAAQSAVHDLPETIGDVAPWIRDFAGIQRVLQAGNAAR